MALKSWSCKGCTNLCHMIGPSGEVCTYCRTIYDQPNHKGKKWITEDYIDCLDYTTDPEAEDRQVRIWTEPKYVRRTDRHILYERRRG